ncbi:unnamed protein product [Vicia faba]|uniref:Uncharacterized protein n=1 Tax=Vicia faba TaxID=3906 RepID=A0AAV1BBP6_VICFA|nr:unnamed protein product [Vicia faba]
MVMERFSVYIQESWQESLWVMFEESYRMREKMEVVEVLTFVVELENPMVDDVHVNPGFDDREDDSGFDDSGDSGFEDGEVDSGFEDGEVDSGFDDGGDSSGKLRGLLWKKRHRPWQVTIRRFGHEEGNEDGSNKYIFGYCKWCWVFGYDMVLTDFLLLRFKPFALLPVTYVKSCSTDTSDLIVLTLPFPCIREISIILMHAAKSTHIIFVCRTTTAKAPTLPMHLTSNSFPNLQDTWPAHQ